MLPTIAGARARAQTPAKASAWRSIDEVMFEPARWFVIDASNQRVPGVRVPSLEAGLALIGRGTVATVVGRLRAGFWVVDVDVPGVAGEAITEAIAQWCERVTVWHVVRPSGGAEGRHHVFLAPCERLEQLHAHLEHVRGMFGASASKVDLRTSVRPLSAPHRHGTNPRPYGAARDVLAHLTAGAASRATRPAKPRIRSRRRRGPAIALEPQRHRQRRPLEEKWARFLATGRRPAWKGADEPGRDASRSTYELMCTAAMLRAGWTHAQAWEAITSSHPDAMTHAKQDRHRWIAGVWNAAVRSDDAFRPTPQIDPDVLAATDEARARVRAAAWALPQRARPTFLLVAWTILRRMETTNSLRVPVPERDLVLDTGIRCRKTIRQQLRRLEASVGTLHRDGLDVAGAKDSSSYEFEVPAALARGVREIPPPSLHIPLRTQLPASITPTAHQLLTHLTHAGLPLLDLAALSQSTATPTAAPSASTLRTLEAHLLELQSHGLAHCDEAGRWSRPNELPECVATTSHTDYAPLREDVATERATWRTNPTCEWTRQQRAEAARCRHKARSWWDTLPAHVQARRRAQLEGAFHRLSLAEQDAMRGRLTRRNHANGVDEQSRAQAWRDSWTPQEWERRREAGLERWHRLEPAQRPAAARAWSAHRQRTGLPRLT